MDHVKVGGIFLAFQGCERLLLICKKLHESVHWQLSGVARVLLRTAEMLVIETRFIANRSFLGRGARAWKWPTLFVVRFEVDSVARRGKVRKLGCGHSLLGAALAARAEGVRHWEGVAE